MDNATLQRLAQALLGAGGHRSNATSLMGPAPPVSTPMPAPPGPADFARMAQMQQQGAAQPPVSAPPPPPPMMGAPPVQAPPSGPAGSIAGGAAGGGIPNIPMAPPVSAPPPPMPPVSAPAPAMPPMGPQDAAATGAATGPPTSLIPPSLQGGAQNPGMARVPQTAQQLEDWRKMMDKFQFARQGQ